MKMLSPKKIAKELLNTFFYVFALILLPIMFFLRIVLRGQRQYRIRSIWTGAPILTMPLNARVEKRLGFATKTIVRSTNFITNQFDLDILATAHKNRFVALIMTYAIFVWVCVTAGRVHAYADGGLLTSSKKSCFNCFELFFYKLLRVKLFIWTYGGDVRTRNVTKMLGLPNCCIHCIAIGNLCICDDKTATQNYQRVSRVAKAVFSMGDMMEYTPNSRNDLFYWPIDLNKNKGDTYRPSYPSSVSEKPLRVVHASNHMHFKGTSYLEIATNELIAEGIDIELIVVERLSNEEALAIYRTADLIFDQCLIGFHGYFAIEAMALGKPVMCYIRYPEKYLLYPEQCPIVNIHCDNLKHTLRSFATTERHLLRSLGHQSRAYVEQHYSLDAFEKRLSKCYQELGVIHE